MEDKSISYDSQGSDPAKASAAPRILARLPRVSIAAAPEKITRTDPAEQAVIGPRLAPTEAPQAPTVSAGDPTATVRFDTFPTASGYIEREDEPDATRVSGAPVAVEPQSLTSEDSETGSWLVRLETAILPYERWVALAAVIAALGLTLTLLGGKPTSRPVESPLPTGFAATEAAVSPVPTIEIGQQDVVAIEAESPAATATGPTGMPQNQGPQAHLVQSVLPVEASEAIGRPLQETLPLDPPTAQDSYPRTANAVDPWNAQAGETRR